MKRDTTPRGQLLAALTAGGFRCLAQIPITKKENVRPYNLEFWAGPTPAPGRLVVIQFWEEGGWDAYVPIKASKTEEAIDELLLGDPRELAAPAMLGALEKAESFLSGFEDCDNPEDRPAMLGEVRSAIAAAKRAKAVQVKSG